MNLRGAIVIVTGASSGIGAATARLCAAAGADVILVARSVDTLSELQDQICAANGSALVIPTDLGDAASIERLAATALDRFERVDVLINCAGFGVFNTAQDASFDELEAMMQINLYGSVRCIKALLPQMLARHHGQIVNVASVAGLLAVPTLGFYSATKFALVGWTRSLQLELQGSGVRCALICPHVVRTPFFQRADLTKVNKVAYLLPWLDADDVARVIVRAIQRDANSEIVIPAIGKLLLYLATLLPGVARFIIRLLK